MLDYAALAVISTVVREGTFERAAAALNISPSAVSQRVRALEERLGSVLIVRSQPCRPTEQGRALCAHFEQVQLLEADLVGQWPAYAAAEQQPVTIKVAVNSDSLATWFPAAMIRFATTAEMLIDLAVDDEAHTADRLRLGEVLAAVTSDPAPVPGCRTTRLGALRYVACASPSVMARDFPDGLTAQALAAAPYMRFDRRDDLQTRWAQENLGWSPGERRHWIPSTTAFLDLALRGLGWGMHPEVLARPHIDSGQLVELLPGRPLDVILHWTVARLRADALRHLTEAVRQAAGAELPA